MSTISSSAKIFTFCPPPLGKPDPSEPRPKGLDTRNRVVQLGTKDNTCWFAVFNLLRDRYRAPNTTDLPARKFEKLASSLRKSLSAQDRSLPDVANQLNNDGLKNLFTGLTKQKIAIPEVRERLEALDRRCNPEVSVFSVFPDFLNQDKHKNLYDYLVFLKISGPQDIYTQFFTDLKLDPKDLFEITKRQDPMLYQSYCGDQNWDELGWQMKSTLLDHFARQQTAKRFNLQISPWNPQQPIKQLVTELEKRGPLVVGGCFGALHYAVPARDLGKKIGERAVYGWTKTDPKNQNHVTAHTILLVGAEKTSTQELVYYIDPEDVSDPLHPEKQRIYCMSYEKLTSLGTICDYHGFLRNNAPPSVGYALYREKS